MSKKKEYIWDDIELDDETDESFDQFVDKDDDSNPKVEKEKSVKKKKVRRKFKFTKLKIAVILILVISSIVFFSPLFKISSITINDTHFLTKETITKKLGIMENSNVSLFKLILMKFTLSDASINNYTTKYNFSSNDLNINIGEIKPLATQDNEFYYYANNKMNTSQDILLEAPSLLAMKTDTKEKVLKQLSNLKYDIIKEIDEIQLNDNIVNTELLLLKMKDGNLVEININQLANKMKYYDQMSEEIKKKNKGPGILHLNIGDYYEEF